MTQLNPNQPSVWWPCASKTIVETCEYRPEGIHGKASLSLDMCGKLVK